MNNKRNSVIILAKNISMDKEYINILDYSESDLVSLCESNSHLVAKQTNYSFLKPDSNVINVGIPYSSCLEANYIAMQNPSYSNKWFFAFIDKVEYNSESSTNIYYTVDELSTWWSYWTKKQCFVVREHVSDDTIGLNLVPENLETGDYIVNGTDTFIFNDLVFMFNVGKWNNGTDVVSTLVNGIPTAGGFYRLNTISQVRQVIQAYVEETGVSLEDIQNVYIVPRYVTLNNQDETYLQWEGNETPLYTSKTLTKPTTLDTYQPHNNKVLCYPYNYLLVCNTSGGLEKFNYEKFNGNPSFSIGGTATAGASIICTTNNYNGNGSIPTMLTASKFPTLSWSGDAYTNWLTQSGVNIFGHVVDPIKAGYIGAGVEAGIGALSLLSGNAYGIGNLAGGVSRVANTMQAQYEHEVAPNSFYGNANNGDVINAGKKNGFYFYNMSVDRNFARRIDKYFDAFGYKVDEIKSPNFNSRTYWNYVQIGAGEIIGVSSGNISVPESSMDIINNVFRKGTTIWHNHDNIGNYNLNNSIIQN